MLLVVLFAIFAFLSSFFGYNRESTVFRYIGYVLAAVAGTLLFEQLK